MGWLFCYIQEFCCAHAMYVIIILIRILKTKMKYSDIYKFQNEVKENEKTSNQPKNWI